MKTFKTALLAASMFAPMLLAAPASAQVNGIAIAEPESVILSAKALDAANQQISTTYKAQLDQARTRQQTLQTQIESIGAPLDTNKDKRLSEQELAAAQAAKSPVLAQLQSAQTAGANEVARLNAPASRAQAYAIEQISQKYGQAVNAVVTARKISLLLSANVVQFAQPAVDVTSAITAELDRLMPTAPITPPANWQPAQQTVQLQQQFQRLVYLQAIQRAQGAAAPAAAAKPQPKGR